MWPSCTWVCSGEDGGTRLDSQPMFCMGRLYRLRQLSTYPGQRHQASTNCKEVSVHHWGMGHEWVHCNHLTILILLGKTTRQLYLEGRPLKLTDLPTHTRRVLHAATVGRIILLLMHMCICTHMHTSACMEMLHLWGRGDGVACCPHTVSLPDNWQASLHFHQHQAAHGGTWQSYQTPWRNIKSFRQDTSYHFRHQPHTHMSLHQLHAITSPKFH